MLFFRFKCKHPAHRQSPPNATAQIKQASSESDKSSSESQSRIKEDNEIPAERETGQNPASETLDLRQSQQSKIDDTEQKTAEVFNPDGSQEMTDIQDRNSAIPVNVHLPAQKRPPVRPYVAESSVAVVSEQSTNHLMQLDYCKLPERERARQQEISQQRLNKNTEADEETGAEFVGEGVGEDEKDDDEDLASTEQVEAEIDRYESIHREETSPSSLQIANYFLEKYLEMTEQTAVDDGSEADEGEAEESGELEIIIASPTFEDEGYFSMEE